MKESKDRVSLVALRTELEERDNARLSESAEVKTIVLSPEQIEEIHVDEYSLSLFYATRIQPLSLTDIKRQFPEPEAKKAQSVMDRYVKVGLVHVNAEGRYYSNFPHDYINYATYRYDAALESRKDAKVFNLMKEFTGKQDYWRIRSYFSMDAFFTPEQTEELHGMFKQIRIKAKEFANENAKRGSLKDLAFRRLKFYDMLFAFLMVFALSFGIVEHSAARGGGGNDPTKVSNFAGERPPIVLAGGNDPTHPSAFDSDCLTQDSVRILEALGTNTGGGGHDPTRTASGDGGGGHDPGKRTAQVGEGGGGHDPTRVSFSYGDLSCRAQTLAPYVKTCGNNQSTFCKDVRAQAKELWMQIKGMWDI